MFIKVHSLAFSNGIPLFTLKNFKLMRPVFMVKMLLDLKYKMYNFFEFPLAGMDVCRTAVRSDSFLDFV